MLPEALCIIFYLFQRYTRKIHYKLSLSSTEPHDSDHHPRPTDLEHAELTSTHNDFADYQQKPDSSKISDAPVFETTINMDHEKHPDSVAKPNYLTNHAIQITECMTEEDIASYEQKLKTPINEQSQKLVESTAIEISDTISNEKEIPMASFVMDHTKQASINLVTLEHVSTIETTSGESTLKFFPEVIVATEVANTKINSLHEYNTHITNVEESQHEFASPKVQSHFAKKSMDNQYQVAGTHQPTVEESISTLIPKAIEEIVGTARSTIIENISTENYEQMVMQDEVNFIPKKETSATAIPAYDNLLVASSQLTNTHESELCETSEEHPIKTLANISLEPENILSEQLLVASNEMVTPLHQSTPSSFISTPSTEPAFAHDIQETIVYESTSDTIIKSANVHTAEEVHAELETGIEEFQPTVIGKFYFKNSHKHTHIKKYLTYRQYKHHKNTHPHMQTVRI